jgi:uncharacterized protein YraI
MVATRAKEKTMRGTVKGVIVASIVAICPGVAAAIPAQVETDLNVRLGPGTTYGIVDVLPDGAVVDVLACYSGWCEVSWEGFDGFASRAYLDIPDAVKIIAPTTEALLVPGVVVYENRYYDRPVWARGGRVIREATRREIRRDARSDARREVRQNRREVRHNRRINARAERSRDNHTQLQKREARGHVDEHRMRLSESRRQRRSRAAQIHHLQSESMRVHQRRNAIDSSRRRAAERAHAQSRKPPGRLERSHDRHGIRRDTGHRHRH